MNGYELKLRAKELMKTSKPSPVLMGLIFTAVSMLMSALSSTVLSTNITTDNAGRFMNAYQNGNIEKAYTYISTFEPSTTGELISLALTLVSWLVSAGFVIFLLNTIRANGAASYANILDGFGLTLRVILLNILTTLIIAVASLLLIVPGIIMFFAYSQAIYILIDNPDKSVIQCMKESRRMMRGRKWSLFGINMSMIGWYILEGLIGPAAIFVAPYTGLVHGLFYERLRGEQSWDSL